MATPPNYTDLARQQRLAANSRLSFNSVMNGGSPASPSMGHVPHTEIDYNIMYVSGLTSIGPGDPNGLYTRTEDASLSIPFTYYTKTVQLSTYGTSLPTALHISSNEIIFGAESATWVYLITNADIGDDVLTRSTASSAQQLPEGSANWSNFSKYGVGGQLNIQYGRKQV